MVKNSSIALDTNIAIEILNGNETLTKKVGKYQTVYLPFIVCGELLYGAANSSKSKLNLPKFKTFISSCSLLHSNELITEQYAFVRKVLKEKGKPIPENDIWIAATCLANEISLYTLDKHFKFIPNIELIK